MSPFTSQVGVLLLGLLPVTFGATIIPRNNTGQAATCRDFYANIYSSANNTDLSALLPAPPVNQQAVVELFLQSVAAGSTVNQQIAMAPKKLVTGNYNLWFEYCEPVGGNPKGIFHTVHGVQGTAGYWNVNINGDYSYSFAEAAAQAGWATLTYDRLGVGRSDHPDGIEVTQVATDAAQIVTIAQSLRMGNLSDIGKFDKIVSVGHSYGSATLTGVAATNPNLFNATILTGFSNNASTFLGVFGFESEIASEAYPSRFSGLSNAYLIAPSTSIDQQEFFHYPNYTQAALDKFTATKGVYTLGQANTIGGPMMMNRTSYTRPVQIVTGQYDAPFCTANCYVTSLTNGTQLDTAKQLFPSVSSSNFGTYVVPGAGHAINFHPTASMAYQQIIQFVQKVGL